MFSISICFQRFPMFLLFLCQHQVVMGMTHHQEAHADEPQPRIPQHCQKPYDESHHGSIFSLLRRVVSTNVKFLWQAPLFLRRSVEIEQNSCRLHVGTVPSVFEHCSKMIAHRGGTAPKAAVQAAHKPSAEFEERCSKPWQKNRSKTPSTSTGYRSYYDYRLLLA